MVKKLFKHELASYLRVLIPTYLLLMIFAGGYRVIQMFDSDTLVYTIILTVSRVVYGLSVFAMFILSGVLPIVRFYKNLFTSEGYLSFTLPVSPTNHLWVKLLSAVLVYVMTVVAAALSWLIVASGDFLAELVKAISYLIAQIPQMYAADIALGIVEFVILALLGIAYGHLVYYLCIAIGQLFKKNRVIAAVGIYFGFSMIGQVVGTVISIIMTVTGAAFFEAIATFFMNHTTTAIHIIFWASILLELALATAFFLIIRHIMTKRLNLE